MDFYTGKAVLVTGASGFIGSHVVETLLDRGASVTAANLDHTHQLRLPRNLLNSQHVEWVVGDLQDEEYCADIVSEQDYIIMCAANTSGAAVMASDPRVHVTPNIIMNARLIEAAALAKTKGLLFVSSSTVYPAGEDVMTEDRGFEGEPFHTYMGVGWMKRYTEKLCKFYSMKYGLRTVIVRPSNAYGPRDKFDPERSHMIPALIRRVVAREDPFKVWGTGRDVRDFIYVKDLVDGMLTVLEHGDPADAVNIASGPQRAVTVKDVVDTIFEIENFHPQKVEYDSTKPSMIPIRLVSTVKAKNKFNVEAPTGFREGMRWTIDWYKANSTKF